VPALDASDPTYSDRYHRHAPQDSLASFSAMWWNFGSFSLRGRTRAHPSASARPVSTPGGIGFCCVIGFDTRHGGDIVYASRELSALER
jgi:hypothetical protein